MLPFSDFVWQNNKSILSSIKTIKFFHNRTILVDASWTSWSQWSSCDQPCNLGHLVRRRNCNPANYGGNPECVGDADESQECNVDACPGKHCIASHPAGTWRPKDVVTTSFQRCDVVSTSLRHRSNVMCRLGNYHYPTDTHDVKSTFFYDVVLTFWHRFIVHITSCPGMWVVVSFSREPLIVNAKDKTKKEMKECNMQKRLKVVPEEREINFFNFDAKKKPALVVI